MRKYIYLSFYIFLISLLYLEFPLIVFIFLVPIFLYLNQIKKINYTILVFLIIITTLINFSYFYEFGYKYMIIIILVNILIYLPFFIISKFLLSKKYYLFTIPSVFFILFYFMQFSVTGNFWINLVGFLNYFPNSIKYTGSYGNIYLILLFNVLIYKIIIEWKIKKISNLNFFVLFILILNFFVLNTYFFSTNYENNKELKIVGINGNLKQDWEERYTNSSKNFNYYNNLTNIAIKKYKPNIVIWPENTFTHLLEFDFLLKNKLNNISKNNNLSLIVGGIILENKSSNRSKFYDSSFIFDNIKLQIYKAYNPVKILSEGVIEAKNNKNIIIQNSNIGINLCYEENFHNLFSNQINKNNVGFFVVMGNLQYTTNLNAQKLIAKNSRLRAMENNRYLFRIDNGGISQVIDNNGKVIEKIDYDKAGILYSKVKIISDKTFYSIYQKEIDFIIFLISLFILIYFNKKDLKKYFVINYKK